MKHGMELQNFVIRRKIYLALKELVRVSAVVEDDQHQKKEGRGAFVSEAVVMTDQQPEEQQPSISIKLCDNLNQKTVENQLNAEASCIDICQWAANSIHKTITSTNHTEWVSYQI